jgi:hypothetical protein
VHLVGPYYAKPVGCFSLQNSSPVAHGSSYIVGHTLPQALHVLRSYKYFNVKTTSIVLTKKAIPCVNHIHSLSVCLTTDLQHLPQPVLHTVWSSTSSFNLQYPLSYLKSYSNCIGLLPRLPVTSILPLPFLQ